MLEKQRLKSIILAFIITIKGTIGTNENQSKQGEENENTGAENKEIENKHQGKSTKSKDNCLRRIKIMIKF